MQRTVWNKATPHKTVATWSHASHLTFKLDEQDMLDTAGKARTN